MRRRETLGYAYSLAIGRARWAATASKGQLAHLFRGSADRSLASLAYHFQKQQDCLRVPAIRFMRPNRGSL